MDLVRVPQNQVIIYALYDPRDPGVVRYIGKTHNMIARLRHHVRDARRKGTSAKDAWVRDLYPDEPEMRALMIVPADCWEEYECLAIEAFRTPALLNERPGGEGWRDPGKIVSARIAATVKAQWASDDARRAEMSERFKQLWQDEAYRAKMAAAAEARGPYVRKAVDPEVSAERKQQAKIRERERRKERLATDHEYAEKERARARERYRERYWGDPEFRAAEIAKSPAKKARARMKLEHSWDESLGI